VEARPREVTLYKTKEGHAPYKEWFDGLTDKKTRAAIDARLIRVRQGNLGDCESVGEGVFELRIDYGPGYRVYLGQDGQTIVVLLNGGDKSTQAADIQKAKECWKDYKERNKP